MPEIIDQRPNFSLATYFIADQRVAVDIIQWKAWADNRLLTELKQLPLRLLATLALRADEAVEHEEICTLIWGRASEATRRSERVALAHVRQQLGREELGHVKHGAIRTIHGIGLRAVSSLADPPRYPQASSYF